MIKIYKPSTRTTATFVLATFALITSPLAFGGKSWDAPRIVTWNCSGCHGVDGNSQPPFFPRLAGLNAAYTQQKMKEFQAAASPHSDEMFYRIPKLNGRSIDERINMIGIAHSINPEEAKNSADWYAAQKPAPGRSGNATQIEHGKELFLKGLPAEGLLACQTCHGAQGEGMAKAPRLAGQNSTYLLSSLEKFRVGDRKHAPEMTTVVKHVDIEQFRALAAYLQSR